MNFNAHRDGHWVVHDHDGTLLLQPSRPVAIRPRDIWRTVP